MTRPVGYIDESTGLDGYGSVVDYLLENVADLRHPFSVQTFAKMRHDPQIAAILRSYSLAVGRGRYEIDGAGCRDEVVALVADDLGLPIAGFDDDPNSDDAGSRRPQSRRIMAPSGARRRGFTWAEHLRVASLDQVFGHMFFAQAWQPENGRTRLVSVQERMPQTIEGLDLNSDGTLRAVEQKPLTGSTPIEITTADHRLVYYVNEREGSNYYGQSLIRAAYAPWLIKDQMLRVHATSIRRFGMGVWTIEAPNGTPQELAQAQRLAATYQAGQNAGVGMPPGFVAKLTGMTGNVPDALAFVNYLDRQMTRSTLTSILDMAGSEKGNRSLGETVMDLMVYSQQTVAQRKCDTATSQIVVPLVDANWGEDEPAPRIVVGDVGAEAELGADEMANLLHYGGIQPDQPFRSWLRASKGIPAEDPDYTPPADSGTTTPDGGVDA